MVDRIADPESFKYFLFWVFCAGFQLFGFFVVLSVTGSLTYEVILQQSLLAVANAFVNFFALVVVLLLFALSFLFIMGMRQHTFKNVPLHRATLLRWDLWGTRAHECAFVVYDALVSTVAIVLLFVMAFAISVPRMSLDFRTAGIFSASVGVLSGLLFSMIFLYLIMGLGLDIKQKTAYCSDYLAKADQLMDLGSQKKQKKDVKFIAQKFAEELNRMLLLDDYIGDRLNIGRNVATLLVGLFWGNSTEKANTINVLTLIRQRLLDESPFGYRQIVEELVRFSEKNQGLLKLRKALSLQILPAKRVTTIKRLSSKSIVFTIVGLAIAIISFIASFVQRHI
jgi:hypothetical protein